MPDESLDENTRGRLLAARLLMDSNRRMEGYVRQLEATGEADISSKQLGELVMETLKEVDAVAYVRFASVYRDFREAKDFEAFLGSLDEPT